MVCCKGSSPNDCVCAAQAKCSCGNKPAMQCDCARAAEENKVGSNSCPCGKRNADACTCGSRDGEIDFTNHKF